MHVLALRIELRLPAARSLKEKRARLRPLLDAGRHRFPVAMAEVDHHETWQRTAIGVAVVSSSAGQAVEIIDEVERFVWARPDLEVLSAERHWLEVDS